MKNVTEYMDGTHLYLGVEAVLTQDEKNRFLTNVCAKFPRFQGADVADVIDIMDDHDMDLEIHEPLYEQHEDEIKAFKQPRLFSLCFYLAMYIHGPGDRLWWNTLDYMTRWESNRCGHRWRETPQPGEQPAEGGYVWRSCTLDKDHKFPVDHHDRTAPNA